MARRWTSVLIFLVVMVPQGAFAQIVNVQSLLLKEAEEGLTLSGTVKGELRKGNVDYLKAGGGVVAYLRKGRHNLVATGKVDYATQGGDSFIKETFEHVRWRWWVWGKLGVEAFVQHGFKPISRIEARSLVGAGVPFMVLRSRRWLLSGAVDVMYERDRYSESDEYADSGEVHEYLRLDAFATLGWTPSKTKFFVTVYYQPALDDFSNVRVLVDASLFVPIGSRASLGLSVSYSHDTVAPEGVERYDLKTTWSLSGTWGPLWK